MNIKPLTILITGSSSGLGKALFETLSLCTIGHKVIGYDIDQGQDVTRPHDNDVMQNLETLDVLINCAGINSNQMFEEVSQKRFDRVMQVNAFSIVQMTQAFLPHLKASRGTVINIVSNAASIPMTSSLAYNASKAAALMITRQMAHELTPMFGITVFSVSPNKMSGTKMSKEIEANVCQVRGWTPDYAAEYQKKALMHGLETPPETVAQIIANLINTGNMKYMSGCDIPVGK
jgi:NAD(P)-dependent dehydrogenase (short-subunit alcohol dehydrogenase family)